MIKIHDQFLNPLSDSNQSVSITFLQISNGYFFGCVMIFFWDFASSFFLETKLVWRVSNTFAKFIYLWNRYFTLLIGFFGLGFWINLVKADDVILSSEMLTFTPILFGIGLLGVHSVLVVQINTLYRNTPIIPCTAILFVTINLAIQILCFIEIRTEYTNTLLSNSNSTSNEVVLHKPTYILIIGSFISPILLHVIFFFITSYSTRSHGKATEGILIGSVDKPLCYHHSLFTITTSILYIISLIMFLQPSSFEYKLMNFIPPFIFTQVLFSRMYLGIKKENLRSKSICASGNGLRQLRLSTTSSWFQVRKQSRSQVIPISRFDLNPIERHGLFQSEEDFNFNFKNFRSRTNSDNQSEISIPSHPIRLSREYQLEHFPRDSNSHYQLNPTRTRTRSETKPKFFHTHLNENLQHSTTSLIRWPHPSDRSFQGQESSIADITDLELSPRSKPSVFNIIPSNSYKIKSQEKSPTAAFVNQTQ